MLQLDEIDMLADGLPGCHSLLYIEIHVLLTRSPCCRVFLKLGLRFGELSCLIQAKLEIRA